MRRYGLSAAVVMAFAVPAWAQYPPQFVPDGLPAPAGYPLGYSAPPAAYPPEFAPAGWYAPPGAATAPTATPGPCPDPCGFAFDPCYPPHRGKRGRVTGESWIRGDWLYWNFRNMPVPPLLVTGNPAVAGAGIPGSGNAASLLGTTRDLGQFHGLRATFGQWFDQDGELGFEISGFVFGREGTADSFTGSATQTVSVPVIGTNGLVGVYDVSFPGRFTGAAVVGTASQLFGGEGVFLHRWYGNGCVSVDSMWGYRYMQLNERLDLLTQSQAAGAIGTFQGAMLPPGATVFTTDSFRARTEFHGVLLGGRIEGRRDMFTVTAYGKGGVGANVQTLRAEGNTRALVGGTSSVVVGGIRVQPTNFGRDTNTDFSLFGETGIEFGLQVSKHLSVRAGYNLLFWSDVLRPGNVITPLTTLSQVPIDPTFNRAIPATQPATVFRSTDFLAHGLVVGAVFDW
jgi:hypothetical protein